MAAKLNSEPALPPHKWLETRNLVRIAVIVGRRVGLPVEDLDDLVQELRIAVWRAGSETLLNASWVFQAAEYRAIDLQRLRARARTAQPRWPDEQPDQELIGLLRARAALLPSRFRAVYELHLSGCSEREIARDLQLTRGTVRRISTWCRRFFVGRF